MTLTGSARRRPSWHEALLTGIVFQLLAGSCATVLLPASWVWGKQFWWQLDEVRITTLWATGLSYIAAVVVLRHLRKYFGGNVMAHIIPVVAGAFFLAFAFLFFTRSAYSRPMLLVAFGLSLVWCHVEHFLALRYRRRKFAVLPMVPPSTLRSTGNLEIRHLVEPDLHGVRYDAIVADLRGAAMTPVWERFLAECILAHIPVFNARQVAEEISGRVQISHLSENEVGALLPSPLYVVVKRWLDVGAVLVLMPAALPLMALTALAIRLDSAGPALFVQKRVGLGNRDFLIYKFRSMHGDAEASGARLALQGDDRVTRVGGFIRRMRLDELPQLWNVLKGDMSMIGPRPEQRVFVDRFEAEIPFYIYRHVVRPGITGWAQVMQGYVSDVDATRQKIQYDFYYIKHFSLWLDILIALKTIRIVLTGWGAR